MPIAPSDRSAKIIETARPLYPNDDPSHDFAHVERVVANCRSLAADPDIKYPPNLEYLVAAAVLHDIVNLPKNHPERASASLYAAARSLEILAEAGFGPDEIKQIQLIIKEHSYSAGHEASSIESAILQDADRLDALGAIGIMRTVTCGGRFGSSYYRRERGFVNDSVELDDTKFVVDHFYKKLLGLPEKMNTALARKLGFERTKFMRTFLAQLERESSGILHCDLERGETR